MSPPVWGAALALLVPIAVAALWTLPRLRPLASTLAPFCAIPALAVALAGPVPGSVVVTEIFLGVRLGLDETGRAFALLTGLLWTAGGLYARAYLAHDERRQTFFGFFLLTQAGNLGVVFAADALSFYLFFAIMTFAAYGLVVHTRTPEAFRAGRIYLGMAVLGEALLLSGLLLLTTPATVLPFELVGEAYRQAAAPQAVSLLVLAGFAVKAGVLPLHMWLPLAHPVAPTPASALLSGAMIKAGLLGWVRLLPLGQPGFIGIGELVVLAGLLTALYGVAIGVTQKDPKTLLAYSSVSQMGYMAAAVGLGLAAPAEHLPVALLAVGLYALHHGIAKGALFLSVGIVPGPAAPAAWRRLVWVGAAAPALALAGAPLTTGATAKLALKHGLAALPEAWPWPLDLFLVLGTIGTTLLMARFLSILPSAGAARPSWQPVSGLWLPWAMLVVPSLFGPLWLPWAYPAPVAVVLSPAEELVAGLWPVLVGAALAAAVWRFQHELPHLLEPTVPAGDLIVPLTHLADAGRRRLNAVNVPVDTWLFQLLDQAGARLYTVGGWLAAAEPGFGRSLTCGLLVLALLALLAFALAGG